MKFVGLETMSLLTRLPLRGDTFGRTGGPFAGGSSSSLRVKLFVPRAAMGSSFGVPQRRRDAVAVVAGIMASKS